MTDRRGTQDRHGTVPVAAFPKKKKI